jgi:hypothetical protein
VEGAIALGRGEYNAPTAPNQVESGEYRFGIIRSDIDEYVGPAADRLGDSPGDVGGLDVDRYVRSQTECKIESVAIVAETGDPNPSRTVNGGVDSDLDLESTERTSRRRLQGRLGSGRGSLELSTVNGGIRLRRS